MKDRKTTFIHENMCIENNYIMLLIMNNIILKCHVFFWNFLKHVFLAKKKFLSSRLEFPVSVCPLMIKNMHIQVTSVTAFIFTVSKIQMLYQV